MGKVAVHVNIMVAASAELFLEMREVCAVASPLCEHVHHTAHSTQHTAIGWLKMTAGSYSLQPDAHKYHARWQAVAFVLPRHSK